MVTVKYPFDSTWIDYPDNDSLAVLIYFMGCEKNCKDCHNSAFKNPNYNLNTRTMNMKEFIEAVDIFSQIYRTNKIILTGGDPLSKYNIKFVREFLNKTKFDVCIYTSYDIDYVKKNSVQGFRFIKCGEYKEESKQKSEKTDDVFKLASTNQNIYNKEYKLISKHGVLNF